MPASARGRHSIAPSGARANHNSINIGASLSCFQDADFDRDAALRRVVEDNGIWGFDKKTHAGAAARASVAAARSEIRLFDSVLAAGLASARNADPGRLKTAIGTLAAIAGQSRQ